MQATIATLQSYVNKLITQRAFENLFSPPLPSRNNQFDALFQFPKTTDYSNWILERTRLKDFRRIVGQSDSCLYNQIIRHEDIPMADGKDRAVNGIYIIGD